MAWSAPHTFASGEAVSAATMNTYIKDNLIDLDRRSTVIHNEVDTQQTTTSGAYTDLTTPGPAITVTTGTLCLVGLVAEMTNSILSYSAVGVAVSGATTIAAGDERSLSYSPISAGWYAFWGSAWVYTLTPGSNTFTMKYRVGGGTGTFIMRRIWGLPLSSA